jgi:hypothetical protein
MSTLSRHAANFMARSCSGARVRTTKGVTLKDDGPEGQAVDEALCPIVPGGGTVRPSHGLAKASSRGAFLFCPRVGSSSSTGSSSPPPIATARTSTGLVGNEWPIKPEIVLEGGNLAISEPNKFGRTAFHGLDLKWDMQGPQESEDEFVQRINVLKRPLTAAGKRAKVTTKESFPWDLGVRLRSRGTVQSDRRHGRMSGLVGDKLIAVVPILGWWDARRPMKTQEMRFSLVVSMIGPGVYVSIKPRIEAAAAIPVEVG